MKQVIRMLQSSAGSRSLAGPGAGVATLVYSRPGRGGSPGVWLRRNPTTMFGEAMETVAAKP